MSKLSKASKGKSYQINTVSVGDTVVLSDGTEAVVCSVSPFEKEIKQVHKGRVVTCKIVGGPHKGAAINNAFLDDDEVVVASRKAGPTRLDNFVSWLFGSGNRKAANDNTKGLPNGANRGLPGPTTSTAA